MSTPPRDPEPPGRPPTPPSSETGAGGEAPELHPAVPAIISLFFPGLGLLLLKTRDRVKDALLIFGVYFAYCAGAAVLSLVVVGLCCWIPLPLLNLAAAIHSYDEAILLEGGKPLLFQKGFRIFKD